MKRAPAYLAIFVALGGVVRAEPVAMPSGLEAELREVLLDEQADGMWTRFRFLAPQLQGGASGVDFEAVGPDLEYLCNRLAIPYLKDSELEPVRIVISLADRMVEFGASDPEATQVFESYILKNDTCIWEPF